jgi:hypothetical protein
VASSKLSDFERQAIRVAHSQGWSIRQIAAHFGKAKSTIGRFLNTPPETLDHIEPVFPVNAFSQSAEPAMIRIGEPRVCMVTHRSGLDYLPSMQPSADDPRPEPTIYRPDELKGGRS